MMTTATPLLLGVLLFCIPVVVVLLCHSSSIAFEDSAAPAAAAVAVIDENTGDSHDDGGDVVLITGATGRLGSKLYFELQQKQKQQRLRTGTGTTRISEVRALVRNVTKAKEVLQCNRCDASEGIYLGDVTAVDGLDAATKDGKVTTLVIAAAAGIATPKHMMKAIEFDGVVNSVRAVTMHQNPSSSSSSSTTPRRLPKVVLCSSMGTTGLPDPDQKNGGFDFYSILHWKLNAEAFLSSSGVPSYIVKPCGLDDRLEGQDYAMFTGHFDEPSNNHGVTRTNVAHVMTEAVLMPTMTNSYPHHRFDLCSKPGPPTTDYKKILQESRWEWEK